jgi:hypothetical protein
MRCLQPCGYLKPKVMKMLNLIRNISADLQWYLLEIGVGLTGFGILFTFLGIIMFFDGGLLAMGNVGILWLCIVWYKWIYLLYLDFIYSRCDLGYWNGENPSFFFSKTEITWKYLFFGWCFSRIPSLPKIRTTYWSFWVYEFVWVCIVSICKQDLYLKRGIKFIKLTWWFSDFFPVILSFFRRIPIIGRAFNVPGLRHVSK